MRRVLLAGLVLAAAAMPALAHDFWLQPRTFRVPVPAVIPMYIYVGHGAARERWGVSADRVVQFRSFGPAGEADRMSQLTLDGPRFDAIVRVSEPGSHVFAFQSKPTPSELPALRFNEYAAAEGLTLIQAARKRGGTEQSVGRELYSRRAKAIIHVGAVDAASIKRVTQPVGLELEVVPERHPLALKAGEKLPVRILFNRKPLAGALVKLTNLDADAEPIAMQRSGRDGRAAFDVPRTGQWQFNVVWSVPLRGNPGADFETTFSSLTYGF